jgi:hypothetical protein
MAFPAQPAPKTTDETTDDGIRWLEPAEERALFEERTHALLGISGEEFLRRLDAGEYDPVFDDPDHRDITYLVMLSVVAR